MITQDTDFVTPSDTKENLAKAPAANVTVADCVPETYELEQGMGPVSKDTLELLVTARVLDPALLVLHWIDVIVNVTPYTFRHSSMG